MRARLASRPASRAAALVLAGLAPAAAAAGDPSGLDPARIDACLAAAPSQGARADCRQAAREACVETVTRSKPDLGELDIRAGCLDADRQAWEAKLAAVTDQVRAEVTRAYPEHEPALAAMLAAWPAYRDAMCGFENRWFGVGSAGIMAEDECLADETARQVAVMLQYLDGVR